MPDQIWQYQARAEPPALDASTPLPTASGDLPPCVRRRLVVEFRTPEWGRADAPVSPDMGWHPLILVAEGPRWATVASGMTPPERP